MFAAGIVAAVAARPGHTGAGGGRTACETVTRSELRSAPDWPAAAGRPDTPDGDVPGATVCLYRADSGPGSATVFAVGRNATAFYEQQLNAPAGGKRDIGRDGYRAFALEDPPRFQTFFLLKHGEYVNVLLYDFPAGAAERLAGAVAAGLP